MDLKSLKNEMPFQWRVQSFDKKKPSATCVAYIDARDVANALDTAVGPENWQDEYKIVGDMLFAGIGIKICGEWVWKWDTGSESNIEKEKGHVSDSFKRAAVKWGVGRFLYELPIQKVKANEPTNQYRDVLDDSGKKVWDLTKHINGMLRHPAQRRPEVSPPPSQVAKPAPTNVTISDPQRKALMALYGSAPRDVRIADANALLQAAKPGCPTITSFSELTPMMANYLIGKLEAAKSA